MVILLLFNRDSTWTIEQIQDETQIKSELLLQVVFGLLKTKLLVCTDINENELSEELKAAKIKTSYSIQLAPDFKR
jgi:cullin 1